MTEITVGHTKGPWTVGEVEGKDEPRILAPEGWTIATFPFGLSDDEDMANARLIAAAPELLEALKALIALHSDWSSGSASVRKAFIVANDAAIKSARTAITKAGGK